MTALTLTIYHYLILVLSFLENNMHSKRILYFVLRCDPRWIHMHFVDHSLALVCLSCTCNSIRMNQWKLAHRHLGNKQEEPFSTTTQSHSIVHRSALSGALKTFLQSSDPADGLAICPLHFTGFDLVIICEAQYLLIVKMYFWINK